MSFNTTGQNKGLPSANLRTFMSNKHGPSAEKEQAGNSTKRHWQKNTSQSRA